MSAVVLALLQFAPQLLVSVPTDGYRWEASARPVIRVNTIIDRCDRLVVAVVAETRPVPSVAEISADHFARLEIQDAPFGSASEFLWVCVRGRKPALGERAVWPIEELLFLDTHDWEKIVDLRETLGVESLWMLSESLGDAWVVERQGDHEYVHVPTRLVNDDSSRIELTALKRAVRAHVSRALPRFEVRSVSSGPSGVGNARVAVDGSIQVGGRFKKRLGAKDHAVWLQSFERSDFATLPRWVGTSRGPCESFSVLTYVSATGRRKVSLQSQVVPNATQLEREQFERATALLTAFRSIVPRDG